jgi:hypothetical protein
VRDSFRRSRCTFRLFRFAFFGPVSCCWIDLFALDVGHLAERMFFARNTQEQHAESDSSNAAAEEKSHNALAQLSASGVACKAKTAMVARDRRSTLSSRPKGRERRAQQPEQSSSTKD